MPSLCSCIEDAKSALLAGDARQAEAICRQVLQLYPRHILANCLLAEARRNQGFSEEASDLFLRVLSADPENLIARWALSVIAEANDDLVGAVYELERAWELNPGHPELRQELVRLTGELPATTFIGLARLLVRGGLLDRAIEELEDALAMDPSRLDTRIVLAETLWLDGQRVSAARACEEILDDSPDCLKANLLLGYHLVSQANGSSKYGERLLRWAQRLAPDLQVALSLLGQEAIDQEPIASLLAYQSGEVADVGAIGWYSDQDATADGRPVGTGSEPSVLLRGPIVGEARAILRGLETIDADPSISNESHRVSADDEQRQIAHWLDRPSEHLSAPVTSPYSAEPIPPASEALDGTEDWDDLLEMEVGLDPEAEARIDAALAEIGLQRPEHEPGEWIEVSTGQGGLRASLDDIAESKNGYGEGEAAIAPYTSKQEPSPPQVRELESTDHQMVPQADPEQLKARAHERPGTEQPALSEAVVPAEMPLTEVGLDAPTEWSPILTDTGERAMSPRDRLTAARASQESGDWDVAVEEYHQLVRSSADLVEEIIDNLKWLIYASPDHAQAHRALGDAYMRCGRFQQAIDEYNWVLAQKRSTEDESGD